MKPDGNDSISGQHVRQALKSFRNLEELGKNPLVSLLWIVESRRQKENYRNDAMGRGLALREVLKGAIGQLRPEGAQPDDLSGRKDWQKYCAVEQYYTQDITAETASALLDMPKRTYDQRLSEAIGEITSKIYELEMAAPPGDSKPIPASDPFYIKREADNELKKLITNPGEAITIRAPRETGKTSLLKNGLQYARKQGIDYVFLDLQRFGRDLLNSYDSFLRELAAWTIYQLQIELNLDQAWRSTLAPNHKLTTLMENHILPAIKGQLILALDEADSLLLHKSFPHKDFFGLLRSWHNERTGSTLWSNLTLVLVISTEPHLLIDDPYQSPFNVGHHIYLHDFNETEVQSLHQRYDAPPLNPQEIPLLLDLLGGHPHLTSMALRLLNLFPEKWTSWADLDNAATANEGPFGTHLRHLRGQLSNQPDLQQALKQVIHFNFCTDEEASFRLLRAGLIRGSGNSYTCRCRLYQRYFEDKL